MCVCIGWCTSLGSCSACFVVPSGIKHLVSSWQSPCSDNLSTLLLFTRGILIVYAWPVDMYARDDQWFLVAAVLKNIEIFTVTCLELLVLTLHIIAYSCILLHCHSSTLLHILVYYCIFWYNYSCILLHTFVHYCMLLCTIGYSCILCIFYVHSIGHSSPIQCVRPVSSNLSIHRRQRLPGRSKGRGTTQGLSLTSTGGQAAGARYPWLRASRLHMGRNSQHWSL